MYGRSQKSYRRRNLIEHRNSYCCPVCVFTPPWGYLLDSLTYYTLISQLIVCLLMLTFDSQAIRVTDPSLHVSYVDRGNLHASLNRYGTHLAYLCLNSGWLWVKPAWLWRRFGQLVNLDKIVLLVLQVGWQHHDAVAAFVAFYGFVQTKNSTGGILRCAAFRFP